EAPAARHEFGREPIKQFRVRWPGALQTEIVLRFNQSLAEILLPYAIHDHSGGQGILRRNEPVREIETIGEAARRAGCPGEWMKHRGRSRFDMLALAGEVAFDHDERFARVGALLHDERGSQSGLCFLELVKLFASLTVATISVAECVECCGRLEL